MKKKYYSIRVVWAESPDEAIEEVVSENFDESDPVCDTVLDQQELLRCLRTNIC